MELLIAIDILGKDSYWDFRYKNCPYLLIFPWYRSI